MGDKYARGRGLPRRPDPNRHPHVRNWSTWVSVGYGEPGYQDACTEREECDTYTEWRKVAECTRGEIWDLDDSTCPAASGRNSLEWTYDYLRSYNTTENGIEIEIDVYAILHPFEVKFDSNCNDGDIIH